MSTRPHLQDACYDVATFPFLPESAECSNELFRCVQTFWGGSLTYIDSEVTFPILSSAMFVDEARAHELAVMNPDHDIQASIGAQDKSFISGGCIKFCSQFGHPGSSREALRYNDMHVMVT